MYIHSCKLKNGDSKNPVHTLKQFGHDINFFKNGLVILFRNHLNIYSFDIIQAVEKLIIQNTKYCIVALYFLI